MRTCAHCGRWFRSKQSVRAHLRHCTAWHEEKERREQEALYPDFDTASDDPAPAVPRRELLCSHCHTSSHTGGICPCGSRTWIEVFPGPPWYFCAHCDEPAPGNNPRVYCPCGQRGWVRAASDDEDQAR